MRVTLWSIWHWMPPTYIGVVVNLGLEEFLSSHPWNRHQINFKKTSWNFFRFLIWRLTLDHRGWPFSFKIHVVLWSSLGKVFHWMLYGNEWEPMVTNGERMVKQWEKLRGTHFHSQLMGIQWWITGKIQMVFFTIRYYWEINGISLGIFS